MKQVADVKACECLFEGSIQTPSTHQMKRNYIKVVIGVVMLCAYLLETGWVQAESINLDEASRMVIAKNLGIQILRKNIDVETYRIDSEVGRYDLTLEGGLAFSKDRSPSASVFAPSKSEQLDFYTSLDKKLLTGTKVVAEWLSHRNESDSTFVTPNPSYDMDASVVFQQSIGKNAFGVIDRAQLHQIKIDVKRFKYDRLRQIEHHLGQIRNLYYLAVQAETKFHIAEEGLKDASTFDETSKEKLRIGILESPDKLASEANVKRREISVLVAKNQYLDVLNRLKNQLILPLEFDLKLEPPTEYLSQAEVSEMSLDKALRYDWLALQQKLEWARLQVDISRSNLLPSTTLDGGVEWSGLNRDHQQAFEDAFSNQFPEYSLSMNVRMPLQNKTAQANWKQSKDVIERIYLEVAELERWIELEVDEAKREVVDSKRGVEIAKNIVELQQKKLEAEMSRFGQGRSGADIIIRYQEDLLSAKEALADRKMNYTSALDSLRIARGVLVRAFESDQELSI